MNSHDTVLWYLEEQGKRFTFLLNRQTGQRYGQAFFNALSREDQEKIRGTVWDTFYSDEPFDCFLAISNVLTI